MTEFTGFGEKSHRSNTREIKMRSGVIMAANLKSGT